MKDLTELKSKRKLREKHFLNKDGTITAYLYNNDIHYLKNGEYIDIDNTLIKEEYYYKNKENAFNTYFKYKNIDNEIIKIEKEEYYLNINLKNKIKPIIGKTRNNGMKYNNILNNIDLKYELIQNKIKESIILNKNTSDDITFILDTNLKIDLKEDKTIELKEEDTIFIIDAPYMFDSDNNYNYNIYYRLNNNELTLVLDYDWLKEAVYPVTIDPTITTRTESNSVYDTYIYQGDTNVNRNNQDILKIGTYRENGVDTTYRTLLKFDLPTIGTGSEVIHAEAVLTSHVSSIADWTKDSMVVDSNMLTSDWNETTANWNNMNNNYNARIDGVSYFNGSIYLGQTINLTNNYVNITNMVKKWYSGTPNYGLILKANKEEYQLDCNKANCYSKSHNLTELDPTPFLAITYRNQNGIESYMTYQNQSFTDGINYVNNYNGNLTSIFDIGRTISGKFPVSLNIVYNTNDVVLNNNFGYGIGYKLNLHQTVKGVTIEEQSLLEYIDEDGTIHYFKKKTEEIYNEHGVEIIEVGDDYYDEDGLGLTLLKDNNNYIMKDKNNNQYLFILNNNTWYLKEIIDTNSNQVIISYDINNRINSVVDANNEKINITYNTNQIIIVSPNETVYLNYDNNKIISITTKKGTTTFTYNNYNIIETITDTNGKKMKYEYYNVSPYRVKKIVEYGTNDSIGTYLEYYYGFQTTTVTDNKISHTTYTFNTFGNTVSTSNLNANEEVKHAYGKVDVYGWYKSETNKIVNDNSRFQYVNNYLKNTSFEQNTLDFTSSSNINALISEDECRTGTRSLKLTNTVNNEYVSQELEVTKGYYYTFSAYIKNNNNLRLKLSYADSNNQIVTEHTPLITVNNNFNRYDVTIYYKEEAISNLTITIYSETIGTVYIDDIQLEEGELANYYNLIYNSNFSDGINEWNIIAHPYNALSEDDTINPNYNIITLSNNQKSLVLNSDPYYGQTVEKTFNIKGKQGDSYTISFWYKNLGVLSTNETYQSYITGIILTFKYNDTSTGHGESITGPLNINETEWQYFSQTFVAEKDYNNVVLNIFNSRDANKLYLTNFSLYKVLQGIYYNYDDSGNLIKTYDETKKPTSLKYDKNNQLINMSDFQGKNFDFEYDNVITDRILNGISQTGISNKIEYNEFGNPINTKISNVRINKDLMDTQYYIRHKGTNKYINLNFNTKTVKLTEETCSTISWEIIKEDNYYKVKQPQSNGYLTAKDNAIKTTYYNNDLILFELTKQDNGSYLIKSKPTGKYITVENDTIVLSDLIEDSYTQQFYFEDTYTDLFIENTAEYTEDGKYIKRTKDTLGNTTTYDIENTSGLK